MEVKGLCKDCLFLQQEWKLDWKRDRSKEVQLYLVKEKYCRICDVFKADDGYCDMWEQDV